MRRGWKQNSEQIKAANQDSIRQQENLRAQQLQLVRQGDLMAEQAVTAPVFQLMQILESIANSTDVRVGNSQYTGRTAFKEIFRQFHPQGARFVRMPNADQTADPHQRRQQLSQAYSEFHRTYNNELSHFFRSLYTIIRFIHDSPLSDDKKRNFVRMVRMQLTQSQLLLLFYNGLTDGHGYPKFFNLIKKHRVLDNLDVSQLFHQPDRDLYDRLPYVNMAP